MGHATGKVSRRDDAIKLYTMDEAHTATEISDQVASIAEQLGVTVKTVTGYIKDAYEEQTWDFPAVGSESEAILDWLVANSDCSKEQFAKFMRTAGKDGKPRSNSNVNEYWKGMTLHRRIVKATHVEADAE